MKIVIKYQIIIIRVKNKLYIVVYINQMIWLMLLVKDVNMKIVIKDQLIIIKVKNKLYIVYNINQII